MEVYIAVEGDLDEIVVTKVLTKIGIKVKISYGKKGKDFIMVNLNKYNYAAKHSTIPWLLLVDLDNDADCAPPFVKEKLPLPATNMIFRVAVRKIESWLLSDREAIASFLEIPMEKVPTLCDALRDPKAQLINLARKSRSRKIIEDMVPRPDSGSKQGPLYTYRMKYFAEQFWRPEIASKNSDSLNRFIKALRKAAQKP
jgi:hypothetical protein